jgi:hypothetical protein
VTHQLFSLTWGSAEGSHIRKGHSITVVGPCDIYSARKPNRQPGSTVAPVRSAQAEAQRMPGRVKEHPE